ncbi:uncharacterized protein LOC100570671 precursor [Acyrthosiphon pisum]|uniref:ACYPI38480 protein n=1 Tax=Acyrthosiphon pisum TaxID=7029 RepID=C4WRY0_ACYPI|nr:uncharacterized protein LOC100570671 precursor [Acyrthosiphon pisum]BAH70650.1 ACYPI38480 [Acyrthosiphon pisum]|eukprot:NP_001232968.1 uncharacterized protein LOC100570671 precursor [Acyrthosiphon pisum]
MNVFVFIILVTLSVALSNPVNYAKTYSPITLCMKSDYSRCNNVSYPTGCVNMDTVVMNSAGNSSGSVTTAFKTIESVIVTDIDSNEDKCIVFFDTYNCQGRSLVLNGSKRPSANLADFKFANLAESYRQCTERLLTWLRDNNVNN